MVSPTADDQPGSQPVAYNNEEATRHFYLEHPSDSRQQGRRQHHIKVLGCKENFSEVMRRAVCQRVRGQALSGRCSAAARGPLGPGDEFVPHVFGDGLGVCDGEEAVLLVRTFQDLRRSLTSEETAQIRVATEVKTSPLLVRIYPNIGSI